jgi:hypothetical protein
MNEFISKQKVFASILSISLFFLFSCSEKQDFSVNGKASLSVNLIGESIKNSKATSSGNNNQKIIKASHNGRQKVADEKGYQIKFDKDHVVEVILNPVEEINFVNEFQGESNKELRASNNSTSIQQPLGSNIKYHVAIYKGDNLVQQKTFSPNGTNTPFTGLDAGSGYSLVAYSFGNTSITQINAYQRLSEASIPLESDTKFLYFFKGNISFSGETENRVDVILDNKIAEIKTLKLNINSEKIPGNFNAIRNVYLDSYGEGNAKIADGSLSFSSNLIQKGFDFPAIVNSREIISTNSLPVKVAIPSGTTGAVLKIGSLSIGGVTKKNLEVPVNITPGTRYEITLNIKEFSSDGIQIGDLIWAPGNLVSLYNGTFWTYSFLSDQDQYSKDEKSGDFWMAGKVIPGRSFTNMNSPISRYNGYPSGDPCSKVSPEWRTPTKGDFQKLFSGAKFNGNPGIPGTYGASSTKGRYYGPSSLVVIPSDISEQKKYLFLPYTGTFRNGNISRDMLDGANYWSSTAESNENYNSLHVRQGYSSLGGWWKLELNPIRCVKDAI